MALILPIIIHYYDCYSLHQGGTVPCKITWCEALSCLYRYGVVWSHISTTQILYCIKIYLYHFPFVLEYFVTKLLFFTSNILLHFYHPNYDLETYRKVCTDIDTFNRKWMVLPVDFCPGKGLV